MRKHGFSEFLKEARRRRVFGVAGLYVVGAWVVLQVADLAFPAMGVPEASIGFIWVGVIVGFPIALVVGWLFDITHGRLIRTKETSSTSELSLQRTDYVVLSLLAVIAAVIVAGTISQITESQQPIPGPDWVAELDHASIAVLPFVNMSDEASNEYFADGISEELLNLLAHIPELKVISRSSVFSYKGKAIKLPQVAEELNVAHILEGSVRKMGNQVRITAQLIDARSDSHLWSETYDRTLTDIFAIQDEIAAAVVAQLKINLLGTTPKATQTDPEAYALYLQAQYLRSQQTFESMSNAVELYRKSLAIDPNYPSAWTGLSSIYIKQGRDGLMPRPEAYHLALAAITNALEVAPDYAPAHAYLARLAIHYDGDLAAAAQHLNRALEIDPNNADVIEIVGILAAFLGRRDEAIAFAEYQVTRDPINPTAHSHVSLSYFTAGYLDEAIESYRTLLTLSPDYIGAQYHLGLALLRNNEATAAPEVMQWEPDEEFRVKGTALALYEMGRKEEFEIAFKELRDRWGQIWPTEIAEVYAWVGNADAAFEWLEKEYDRKGKRSVPEIVTDSLYQNIHDDPRWNPFLEKLEKSPEQLSRINLNLDSNRLKILQTSALGQ